MRPAAPLHSLFTSSYSIRLHHAGEPPIKRHAFSATIQQDIIYRNTLPFIWRKIQVNI